MWRHTCHVIGQLDEQRPRTFDGLHHHCLRRSHGCGQRRLDWVTKPTTSKMVTTTSVTTDTNFNIEVTSADENGANEVVAAVITAAESNNALELAH